GGFGRDVQTGRQAQASQRFFLGEALADAGQDRHVGIGPEDALLALRGQFEVFDVATPLRGRGHSLSIEQREMRSLSAAPRTLVVLRKIAHSSKSVDGQLPLRNSFKNGARGAAGLVPA